jgi:hypothetical protein
MTTEPKPTASPVCYLDEAADHYSGYATPDEILQAIRRWLTQAPSPAIAQALTLLLSAETVNAAPNSDGNVAAGHLSADDLRTEMRQFLPKIRNDALHSALQQIIAAI